MRQNGCMLLLRVFVASLLFTSAALAQTAQLNGRIIDPAGAVVPGADIAVRNAANGTERHAKTNEVGLYTLPLLPPGTYEIRVRRAGFKPILQGGVQLDVDQRATADFVLEVGAVSEQV